MDLLIKAKNIRFEIKEKEILDIPELEIYDYDRIGIIGKNGVGKTTLFNILVKEIEIPNCSVEKFGEIGYIKQMGAYDISKVENKSLIGKLNINNVKEGNMSGGEETKFKIAEALSKDVHAIFADEPTCNLDSESIDFITNTLKYFKGAIVVISHDRQFLDNVVNKIWEIEDGKINEYWGNYSDYLKQKEEEDKTRVQKYEKYINEKNRLEKSMQEKIKKAEKIDKKPKGVSKKDAKAKCNRSFETKSRGSRQKAIYSAAKAIESRINDLEEIDKVKEVKPVKFRISETLELHNKQPISGNEIYKSFGDKKIFEDASFQIPLGSKVAITGPNGSGKTTLLHMILNNEKGIQISPKVKIGYFAQNGYKYEQEINVLECLKENSDYNISEIRATIAKIGIGQNVITRKMKTLSGGEIIKVLLCKMLLGNYNILIMDEPNNFLDIASISALESLMKEYKGTIIFVSHDKKLVENVSDIIYDIKDYKLIRIDKK